MKKLKLSKTIVNTIAVAVLLVSNPIGASAEWKQDNNGWWNSEGSSWSVGWKEIDGKWYYFDNNGYMKTGWVQDEGKWYYLYDNGALAQNTTIDGYSLDSNGAWIQNAQNSYADLDKLPHEYPPTLAQKNGDVVSSLGKYYNKEKLDKFIEIYKNKKASAGDMVRITIYTDEGGAIIHDLIIEGNDIKFIEDNTRDGYSNQTRDEYKVVDIYEKYEKNNTISYYVKTDQGKELCIL
ncbi:DUF4362 domain-containing protein [Clostridium sp. BL-8]|uniref:DUF4362 domain-containing protein n=1 Tax=Clostridium sp. BL-8 TaxID=349938 RepID=UPI00098C907B|nr:DUF4362 domain-containing protein [Clostridium sp. BL-8]OOM75644.1 autolysin [Clostridium sp. BL-8]